MEYEVQHPSWSIWTAPGAGVDVNVAELYGPEFVDALSVQPSSVFIADGSAISVSEGKRLQGAR